MIIINTTMINAVDLDQYTIIDESSMINDDFGNFSKPICHSCNLDKLLIEFISFFPESDCSSQRYKQRYTIFRVPEKL